MSQLHKHISCLFFLLLAVTASPQDIPQLPQAGEIASGRLQNGISWYLVTNPAQKGYADAALVQKSSSAVQPKREALVSLPHFPGQRPHDFLVRNGIGYGTDGYIRHMDGTSVFRFENIPVYSKAVVDSTVLLLFDIASCTETQQALIISGDIDAGALRNRLEVLSLMVNPRSPVSWEDNYIWNPSSEATFSSSQNTTTDLASLEFRYRAPRAPKDRIATVQTLVSEVFSREMGIIVKRRISTLFRSAGIPLADVRYLHEDSSASSGDEVYSLKVFTSSSRLSDALEATASVLSSLDCDGASLAEFQDARAQVESDAVRDADNLIITNGSYIDRCAANYLLGASLASDAAKNGFFSKRRLDSGRELQLFNDFQSAILDSAANLSIRCSAASSVPSDAVLREMFNRGWSLSQGRDSSYRESSIDTTGLFIPPAKPVVKVRREAPEPVSGGVMWTLSNGIRVVYKQTSLKGGFDYAVMLRGGFTEIFDLEDGESAFVSDMLLRSRIAGMSGEEFRNMLQSNGISMDADVSLSGMTVRGSAPSSKLKLLLSSLVSIANMREPEKGGLDYYKACESVRAELSALSQDGVYAVMDSLMCQDFRYPLHKSADKISPDLPAKAENYFAKQFAKVNDGIIMIAGDIPADELKRQVCLYFGDLQTSMKTVTRPRVAYPMTSGWATYTSRIEDCPVGDGTPGVNIAMSSRIPFTRENNIAFYLAAILLDSHLTRELAPYGQYFSIKPVVEVTPVERMTLFMNFRSCKADGLPADVKGGQPITALPAIRSAVGNLSEMKIDPAALQAAKNMLTGIMATRFSSTSTLIDAVLLRYADGKDIVTDYQKIIASTTPDAVRSILVQLAEGGRIEYVII